MNVTAPKAKLFTANRNSDTVTEYKKRRISLPCKKYKTSIRLYKLQLAVVPAHNQTYNPSTLTTEIAIMNEPIWTQPVTLDTFTQRAKNTLCSHLGIEFVEIGDDYLVATMPVDDRTRQPIGIMHGGASCVLAETIGSMAAQYCVDTKTHYCVGLDINTNHIRSIRDGHVIGIAAPYHLGRSTQVWSIEIRNDAQQLISVNRLTMAVLQRQ